MNSKSVQILRRILLFTAVCLLFSQPALAQIKKVALFPLAFHGDASKGYLRPGLRSMFISRLSDRNLEIIGDETMRGVFDAGDSEGIRSPDRAAELGRRVGADYALFGSITTLGGSYSIDLGILDLTQKDPEPQWISKTAAEDQLFAEVANMANTAKAAMGGTVVAAVTAAPPPAAPAAPSMPPPKAVPGETAPQNAQNGLVFKAHQATNMKAPAGSLPVDLEVMASATGDLDGDGAMELLVMARKNILVFTRAGDRFVSKDSLQPSRGTWFLKVSAGDLDGDGRDEICITSENGDRAESSLWTWNGRFEKRHELKGHLRITPSGTSQKPLLLFQESLSDAENFFSGGIWVMGIDGQADPVKKRQLRLPRGAQFYTIAFDDINSDGSAEALFLGRINLRERGRLMLCDAGGKILWQSQETFGGTNNLIVVEDYSSGAKDLRIPLNSDPVLMDTDGDGRREVVVVRNLATADMSTVKRYKNSQLFVFKIAGMGLTPVLTSAENPYHVVGMQVDDGVLYIATHKLPTWSFSKPSGEIMWFK